MAISFPISLPVTPNFVQFDLSLTHQTGRSVSPFTAFTNIHEFSGAFWAFRASLPKMLVGDASEWFGALASLRGGVGTFLLGDPDHLTPRGTGVGTPLVQGGSQTGIELITDGWGSTQTVLKRGDLFQLGSGGSTHLYMVTADAVTDGGGVVTLDIIPRLRVSPANNDPLTISSPQGLWRAQSNTAARASSLAKFEVRLTATEAF